VSRGKRTHRLLIVADESCGARELCRGAAERADAHTTIRLVAPVRLSRGWPTDDDDSCRSAREKLGETLARLRRYGVTADARLGSGEPVAAIEDALVDFAADEILFFTGPDRDSWWLHKEALERVYARFHLPTAHVVLNPPRELSGAA
jgi:hypothetical protein